VGIVLPRKVHYLATAALFRNPLTAQLLVALGVIPVYRKADDPDRMDRNFEMFAFIPKVSPVRRRIRSPESP
jgi:1-acyl-sn-glycerol-3-phosphate acyltransferase